MTSNFPLYASISTKWGLIARKSFYSSPLLYSPYFIQFVMFIIVMVVAVLISLVCFDCIWWIYSLSFFFWNFQRVLMWVFFILWTQESKCLYKFPYPGMWISNLAQGILILWLLISKSLYNASASRLEGPLIAFFLATLLI